MAKSPTASVPKPTRRACFVVSPYFANNRLFAVDSWDGPQSAYKAARDAFAKRGVSLDTQDICPIEQADYVIYMDMPKTLPRPEDKHKSFLQLGEVEVVMPGNWKLWKHEHFAKIFTFCEDYVDNKKYFRLNSSRSFSDDVPIDYDEKTGFCCLISSNKFSSHPLELYSERVRAIRWFEANHPRDFDLYGAMWDMTTFGGLLRPFNRVPAARRLFASHYPSYRGKVARKFDALRGYKFHLSYENARDIPGYVCGDKIFDPMQAGCIPVYWGAPDITRYVPADCFIDRRDFKDYAELYRFMKGISRKEHEAYLKRIRAYIQNVAKTGPFSAEAYADVLVRQVLGKK